MNIYEFVWIPKQCRHIECDILTAIANTRVYHDYNPPFSYLGQY